MEPGIISKEYYIGRYIYLTGELRKLPDISFARIGKYDGVCIRFTDPETGNSVRKRLTEMNKDWERYRVIAVRKLELQKQLNKLLANWKSDHKGRLDVLAQDYELCPDTDNRFNSEFWNSLEADCNPFPKEFPTVHNGIIMRSDFEAEVAGLLEDMGIEYKYEVALDLGYRKPFYPDFALHYPEFNRCGFVEALGGLGGMKYVSHTSFGFDAFANKGLYPNRDVVYIPADREYKPDQESIKRMIGVMCDTLARQYIRRKS